MSFREDGHSTVDWIARYLETVRERPVLARVEPGELRARLPAAPPDEPEPFSAVLRDLDDVLMPALTHWQSPRFFAYFPSTGSEPGILAELLAAGLNQVGILWRTSPALQELEEVALAWLADLLGLPAEWHGHIEDTASTATLSVLAAARAAAPGRRVVVCSEHTHSAVAKAARILELDLRTVRGDAALRHAYRRSSTSRAPAPWWRRSARRPPRRSTRCRRSQTHASGRAPGCTSTRPTRAAPRSARSSGRSSPAGSGPTRWS